MGMVHVIQNCKKQHNYIKGSILHVIKMQVVKNYSLLVLRDNKM